MRPTTKAAWPEPFGLVMIEAMACGTPVIGFRRGSVSEVLKHGVTGFIVQTVEEAVGAVNNISSIDRAQVRATFERRFSVRLWQRVTNMDICALRENVVPMPRGVSGSLRSRAAKPRSFRSTSACSEPAPAGPTCVSATDVVKVSTSQVPNAGEMEAQGKAPVADLPASAEAKFLRIVQKRACAIFSTVLGPEANDEHRTHLHLDLQDRKSLNVCK